MSETNLHDLAARLARGEEAAFAELYDACAGRLHQYLTVRLGSHDAASDAMQAAFLRAVKNRRRFRSVENPIAYLFQIARNEATRAASKCRPTRESSQPIEQLLTTDRGTISADERDVVTAGLAKLDPDARELVELKIYAGLTFKEIADMTAKPQGTVATEYRRALESLRPWLAKQYR
jgi:RNA polymerase sigma-70 factor, ECF subfamily